MNPHYNAPKLASDTMDEMSMLILRLARSLKKARPNNDLSDKAVDYLKRRGMIRSPLRATDLNEEMAQCQ